MTPERWQKIESIYHDALELPTVQRSNFIDRACKDDEDLKAEVISLLASYEASGTFIDAPPDDIAAAAIKANEQARSMSGRTLGHYKVQSLLGSGGMGEVYRARDLRLERDVAIKILPEQLSGDTEALHRFEREAKAVATLSHPNILAIHDFGSEEGISYAVMELLEGETLGERLKRENLNWRKAAEIGAAILEGLNVAHTKGIIHRDLKPANIFLTKDGRVKILDFGIARIKHFVSPDAETSTSSINTTKPGTIMGTFGYMSPEQVRGETADAPSDIFSFGCILHEMLSGHRLYAYDTPAETIAAILKENPPKLRSIDKSIPDALEHFVLHCLEKKPGDRFQSAREPANQLKAILSGTMKTTGKPVVSTPNGKLPLKTSIGVAAAIFLMVTAVSVYMYFGRSKSIDSLAVLPLINDSGNSNLEYLTDGITDSLINRLSQLPELRVMARSTVFTYKGKEVDPRKVGQELNVRAIFLGKLTEHNNDLVIKTELVNTSDGSQLWGEQYTSNHSDIMNVQTDIAGRISEKMRLAMTGKQKQLITKRFTANPQAHQLYLQGRYQWGKFTIAGYDKSIELYKQAIEFDPNYALPFVGLADTYFFMSNISLPPKDAMPRSRAAAMKALEIDDSLAEAHAALAVVKTYYDWEWQDGERAFRRALELNPGYASARNQFGVFLVYMKRFDEAQIEMNRAYEFDPLSPYVHTGTVWPVLFSRRYDEAAQKLKRIIAVNPNFANAYINLGWAYAWSGKYDESIAALQKALNIEKTWYTAASLGYVYARAGKRDEALKILSDLEEQAKKEHVSDYGFAMVYSGLADKDRAFEALQRAYENRDEFLPSIKADPFFDILRGDQRYTELLKKMNLKP